jgi:hypothetical protein
MPSDENSYVAGIVLALVGIAAVAHDNLLFLSNIRIPEGENLPA